MLKRILFDRPLRPAPPQCQSAASLSSSSPGRSFFNPAYRRPAPLHKQLSRPSLRPTSNSSGTIRAPSPSLSLHRSYALLPGGSERRHNRRVSYVQLLMYYWRNSPFFRRTMYTGGAGLGVFVVANIEAVPVSGRRRFNWVSPQYEEQMGEAQYRQLLQELHGSIMPEHAPEVRAVHRVLNRLIPNSGLDGGGGGGEQGPDDNHHNNSSSSGGSNSNSSKKWEIHVIDEPVANAFVLPGGKVFVFRGILPICVDDDGLAAVLGHEIAHNVAHHSAENLSRISFVLPVAWLASLLFDVSGQITYAVLDLAYSRPGSRRQESEADFIGLMMMAASCYDPAKAVGLWQRMEKAGGAKPPQFLSTHPSDHNRVLKIQQWLPAALEKRSEAACGATIGYAEDFKRVVEQVRGDFWPEGEGEILE